ncbi:UNVERIFIED_ORG: hypothetical protein E4P37_08310 [Bacillus sp. AZ43]
MSAEDELRSRLEALADRAGRPSSDPRRLAGDIATAADARRRARRNLVAGLGCLVLVGVAVPQVVDGEPGATPGSGVASAPASIPVRPTQASAGSEFFDHPTRGSLAGDHAFVEGVRSLPWSDGSPVRAADGTVLYHLPDPPVDARSVVFAGDVPGGRWALVIGRMTFAGPELTGVPEDVVPHDELAAAWFAGPPDATVAEMAMVLEPSTVATDWPLALTDPRNGALVVVAAPGDVVEVSRRPQIGADGETTREWLELDTEDGIAIAQVSPFPRPYDGSTSYRVMRQGRIEARDMPWSIPRDDAGQAATVSYPRGRPSELGERVAGYAVERVLAELGLSAAEVRVSAPWVGPVPAGGPGQAAIVTVTLPSGAVVVEAQWLLPEGPDGSVMGAVCGEAVYPAGPPVERRVLAAACEVVDRTTGASMSTSLVVVGPPQVTLVRTYDGDRNFLAEIPAHDGVAVVPMPLGTDTVEAVTSGGVTLGRVDLLGHAVDFGD